MQSCNAPNWWRLRKATCKRINRNAQTSSRLIFWNLAIDMHTSPHAWCSFVFLAWNRKKANIVRDEKKKITRPPWFPCSVAKVYSVVSAFNICSDSKISLPLLFSKIFPDLNVFWAVFYAARWDTGGRKAYTNSAATGKKWWHKKTPRSERFTLSHLHRPDMCVRGLKLWH